MFDLVLFDEALYDGGLSSISGAGSLVPSGSILSLIPSGRTDNFIPSASIEYITPSGNVS